MTRGFFIDACKGFAESPVARDLIFLLVFFVVSLCVPPSQMGVASAALIITILVSHWLHAFAGIEAKDVMNPTWWPDPIDPWEYQRRLMAASDQCMPDTPRITNTSLLYAALIMEETGETLRALQGAMSDARDLTGDEGSIAHTLRGTADMLALRSLAIRSRIECIVFDEPILRKEHVVELFDGTTDIAVVNCGFALASGLPGAAGYEDVAGSNLSKVNPDTGKIDKDRGGKWVKGRNFKKPDLLRVLTEHTGAK